MKQSLMHVCPNTSLQIKTLLGYVKLRGLIVTSSNTIYLRLVIDITVHFLLTGIDGMHYSMNTGILTLIQTHC